MMKRVKANDPAAMREMGAMKHYDEGDYKGAFNYLTKAAELEDIRAHYLLGYMYRRGEGVKKDEEKAVYHSEKAAIGGDPYARYDLACYEERKGNKERAVKHSIIAANLGLEISMKELWKDYKDGYITKEELEATLRTHKAVIDEMKSKERDEAAAWRKRRA
jgi:TPR repeat protein